MPTSLFVLLDLLLPGRCAGCSRPGPALCCTCGAPLRRPRAHRPEPCPAGLPPLAVAGRYAGPVRTALLAYKERGRRDLAAVLGAALAAAIRLVTADLPGPLVLVPVPSRRAVARARGGAHVVGLARAAVPVLARAGVRALVLPAVCVRGSPRDSAGLSGAERAANLAGVFVPTAVLRRRPAGAVIVVDDLVTTGATLMEVSAVLAAAGAPPAAAATVAGTSRRRHALDR